MYAFVSTLVLTVYKPLHCFPTGPTFSKLVFIVVPILGMIRIVPMIGQLGEPQLYHNNYERRVWADVLGAFLLLYGVLAHLPFVERRLGITERYV